MKALNLWIDCPDCDGSGRKRVGSWVEPTYIDCPSCNGTGQVYDPKVLEAMDAEREKWLTDSPVLNIELLDAIVAVADTVKLEWDRRHGLDPLQHEQRLVGPWEEE